MLLNLFVYLERAYFPPSVHCMNIFSASRQFWIPRTALIRHRQQNQQNTIAYALCTNSIES